MLRNFCLNLSGTEESLPFDENTLVFKVAGKMYCATSIKNAVSCNVKCNPEEAIELRERFEAVKPGFHMNKKHWNTIMFNMDMPDKEILQQIQNSYNLVILSLPKKLQNLII